ncbi:MAG: hypothetical protein J6P03_09130 [Opitutales bacterium]|nr:hypothetical protein [Opitutales bacterium]
MDWPIKSLSKNSAQSGQSFKAGDEVVCVVFQNAAGELERADFLKSEYSPEKFKGGFVGKWERKVGENPQEDERRFRRMALAGAEDLFMSLFDGESADIEQKDTLKQMLALLLERKRVLRPVGRPQNGAQRYVHAATKREFSVAQKDLTQELVLNIQKQINAFIL